MALFRRRKSQLLDDLKLICDVMEDFASFAEPEVVSFPGTPLMLRFRILPVLYGLVACDDDQCWWIKYVQVNEKTGDVADEQPELTPVPMGCNTDLSVRQIATNLTYELAERLGAFSQNSALPARQRNYAKGALALIDERLSEGPPRA